MFKCKIEAKWNNQPILTGKATMTMAYDTMRLFFESNFTGMAAKEYVNEISYENMIYLLKEGGGSFTYEFEQASFTITLI